MQNPLQTRDYVPLPLRRIIAWGVATVCAFSLLIGTIRSYGPLKVFAVSSLLRVTTTLPPQDDLGRTNVLILGVGDDDHAAADLTDTIMIASVQPSTQSVVLLSLPRDLFLVENEDTPDGRINGLYYFYKQRALRMHTEIDASGASILALHDLANDIGNRFHVPIHGAMKLDFAGLEMMIDAIGGIDIDVPEAIVDYSYPLSENVIGLLRIEKGMQHMDGKTALQYARSRHSTSDFDRSDRQQQILQALKDKMQHMNFIADAGMLRELQQSIQDHFETTFSPRELFGLAGLGTTIRSNRIIRMNVNFFGGSDTTIASAGGFVYTPPADEVTGAILYPVSRTNNPADLGQIITFAWMLFSQREVYLAQSPIIVESAGANSLEAHRLRNELRRYGLIVQDNEEAQRMQGDSVIMIPRNGDHDAAEFFSRVLDIPVEETSYDDSASGTVVRIKLGADYRFTSLEKLTETLRSSDENVQN
jgi:LCP family protein required for cell wall assembly